MRSCLVDPDGRVWDSREIATHAFDGIMPIPRSKQELLEGLVAGRGYVGINLSERASYFYINPGNTTPATIETARAVLIGRADQFVATAIYCHGWAYKLHNAIAAALSHVEQAVAQAQAHIANRFRSQAVTPTQLANSNFASLLDILSLAESHQQLVDPELVAKVSNQTADRFMICRWDPNANAWVVHTGGLGYDRSHFYLTRDHLINNQPDQDRAYGIWLHEKYQEVATNGAPAAEKVDAIIHSKDYGMLRFAYCRILVPMMDAHQNRLLLTTSQRDHSIDLGLDVGHEIVRV